MIYIPPKETEKEGYHEAHLVPLKDNKGNISGLLWIIYDLTERRESERKIEESQRLLQQTAEASPDAITIYDLEKTTPVYINDRLAKWINIPVERLESMGVEGRLLLVHPEDRRRLLDFNRSMSDATDEEIRTIEYRILNKNKRYLWIRNRSKVFRRNKQGKPTQIISVLQDITATRFIEQQLQEEHRRLKQAQAIGHVGSFEWNEAADIIYWSDEMHRIHGSVPNEGGYTTMERVMSFIHPDDLEQVIREFSKCRREACNINISHRIIRADGEVRQVFRSIQSFADAKGKVVRLSGTLQDITEQSKIQEEIIRLKDEVAQKATDKYQSLFNSIDEGFCIIEVLFDKNDLPYDYRFLEANPAFAGQTGLTDAVGKTMKELAPAHEEHWFTIYGRIAKTGVPERFENVAKELNRHYEVYAFRVDEQAEHHVAILFNDITERKRREADTAFLNEISEHLLHLTSIDETMRLLGEKIAAHFNLAAVAFAEITQDEMGIIDHAWHQSGMPNFVGTYAMKDFVSPEVLEYCRSGKDVVINDVFADPRTDGEQYKALNIGSFLSIPLVREGQWRFLLVVYKTEPYDWQDDEIALTREFASRVWTRLERARAEEALRRNEEKYRSLFESIDEGFAIQELLTDESGNVIDLIYREVNDAFEQHNGMKNAIGKKVSEFVPHLEQHWIDALTQVYQTGEPLRNESYTADLDRWFTYHYSRIGGAGSPLIAVVFNDITERKRREKQQSFLLSFTDAMRNITDPDQIQETACMLLGAEVAAVRVNYAEVSNDEYHVKNEFLVADLPSMKGRYPISSFRKEEINAFRNGKTVAIDDILAQKHITQQEAEVYQAINVRAFISVPLVKDGELVVVLSAIKSHPHKWNQFEIKLIEDVAERTWAAVERAKAEEALRKSEEKFRTLFNSIDEGFCIIEIMYDENGKAWNFGYVEVNPAFSKHTGVEIEYNKTVRDYAPEITDRFIEIFAEVATTGKPTEFTYFADTRNRWFHVNLSHFGSVESNQVAIVFNDVTERKAAEASLLELNNTLDKQVAEKTKELQASKELLENVFQNTSGSIMLLKPVRDNKEKIIDFEYVLTNQHLLRSVNKEQLEGKLLSKEFPGVINSGLLEHYKKVMNTGISWQDEVHINYDGFDVWAQVYASRVNDHLLVTYFDNSARKKAETEVTKQFAILQQTEELAQTGSWEYDIPTKKFIWSEGMYRLFDLAQGTPVVPQLYEDFAVKDDKIIAKRIARKITREYVPIEEIITIQAGNITKTLKVKAVVLHNEKEEPVKMIGVDMDITRLKAAQERTDAIIQEYQQILDSIPHYVWTSTADGLQLFHNAHWIKESGIDPSTNPDAWLATIHADDLEKTKRLWQQALTSGTEYYNEVRIRNAKGEYRWHIARAVPLKDKNGKLRMWVGTSTDIHELKMAENKLRHTKK